MQRTFELGGPVGRDLLAVDWTRTALGPLETWPSSLETVVRMLLGSRFSMWLGWGPELTFFCNESYRRQTLGAKYPWALGRPTAEVWSEIWPDIGPRVEQVLSGGSATWDEDLLLILERSGYPEETYHTFSYSPLHDDDGAIVGMLCVVDESTDEVISRRRLASVRDLATRATGLREVDAIRAASRVLDANPHDVPFHLVYLHGEDGVPRLAGSGGLAGQHPAAPASLGPGDPQVWPVPRAGDAPVVVDHLARFSDLPRGAWDVPPGRAAVLPVRGVQGSAYGTMVVGLNPFRPFDDPYRQYLELVCAQVGAVVTDARAYEFERRRAESLAEVDRAKTDFFTNVSHELRTPLTLMLGPVEDALGDASAPLLPVHRERLSMMHRNGLRLLTLVNSLLDFSRLESGRLDASFEPVDLAAVVRELAGLFQDAAEVLGLRLTVHAEPLPDRVHVDRELFAKVLLNLLSNALKFTAAGEVRVELRAEEDAAVVAVRDTGVGIPAADQPHVFERFRRARSGQGQELEGSGIGLALVAELVELHGGRIDLESTEGQGTVFEVRLPFGSAHLPQDLVHPAAETGHAPSVHGLVEGFLAEVRRRGVEEQHTATSGRGGRDAESHDDVPRVLVVDDSADVRDYVTGLLREEYVVASAVDGVDALDQARRTVPDLVLTDVMMPRLDGFGLIAKLRADPATSHVPVLMLSARGGEESTVEGLEAGADDYLVKPFTARELRARVRANIALARANAAIADQEHQIADELQRSLLPERTFDLAHLHVATFYRAGVLGTQVGGDWYDVIELGSGRTALVVGDVMGRGVRAAAVMGQLRAAVRAYARLDLPLEQVMASLDGLVHDLFPEQIVTCVYAVFDPHTLELRVSNAGHLPPTVAHPDGSHAVPTAEPHPPLGLGKAFAPPEVLQLRPGSRLLLYTDGLVERRGEDLDGRLSDLREQFGALTVPLAEQPERLVEALVAEELDDDVAVLVAAVPLDLGTADG